MPAKPKTPTKTADNRLHTNNQLVGVGNTIPHQNVSDVDLSATQDIDLIKKTLRDIMADVAAPAAAKAQAARTLAEMHQALGRFSGAGTESNKPVKETSRADLEAELAALMGQPTP